MKKPINSILSRIDQRLKALAPSGKKVWSDRAASLASGLSEDGIRTMRRQFETGRQRAVGSDTLDKLAAGLKTTPTWLLDGTGPETIDKPDSIETKTVLREPNTPYGGKMVRIVGYVGAGNLVHYYALDDEDFEEVEAPVHATSRTVAIQIKGKSWGPLMDSWLVFYDDKRSPLTEDLIGDICIIGLADDRILMKQIRRERNGSLTLLSNSAEPPIKNAEINWAVRATDMRRR